MDEPETTLHPEAARDLSEMLMLMARAGIQIFIATHSFFILKQLHISAKRTATTTKCFSLQREKGQMIQWDTYNLMHEFPENPISEEAIRMADEQVMLDLGISR